jgi:hypothetical protein
MFLLVGTSAFVTFLAIAAFGFVFLAASSVFGDLFEHGDLGHDVGGDHGSGPSILSSRILSVFVTAFGSFGAIGIHMGYGVGTSTAMGFGGGIVFAAVLYAFASFLFSQQASSHTRINDLIGRVGEVSVAIPKGGLGQIRCTLGDTVVEKIARSADGEAIPANVLINVDQIVGETVVVHRAP